MTAADILDAVQSIPSTGMATNFYLDESDSFGGFLTSAAERRDRLRSHLRHVGGGDLVLVGEAAGWKGARQSGVPFTSAKTVGLPGVSTEASATIVHGMLRTLSIAHRALLWNAFPLHPHQGGSPRSNRTPTATELAVGLMPLRLAIAGRRVIAVGGKASSSIEELLGATVPAAADVGAADLAVTVRHPAKGGATKFRSELAAVYAAWDL